MKSSCTISSPVPRRPYLVAPGRPALRALLGSALLGAALLGAVLLGAALLGAALLGAMSASAAFATPGGLCVVGSGSTTKRGQHDRAVFTILNSGSAPAQVACAAQAVPAGFTVDAVTPEAMTVEPGEVASVTLDLTVSFAAAEGFHDIPLAWQEAVSKTSGVATARILLSPYDAYSPTLTAEPDPLRLVGSSAGSVRGLAGCLTDNNGTVVPWHITQCPFVFNTRIENPISGSVGLVTVVPLTGPLDIPEGAPTPIPQEVTAPAEAESFGLNVVTIEIDALTPAGWHRTAAYGRYAVVWSRPAARFLAVEPAHWGEIKAQFDGRR